MSRRRAENMTVKEHIAPVDSQPRKAGDNRLIIWIIYINIVLYATCFQLQRPLEPFLVEKLNLKGDSADEYAKLQSFFNIMQTIGSLITGWLLDRFGVKGGFIISFLGSGLSYYLLSESSTISILYLSKVPTIFQNGFLCAQLAIAQLTPDGSERIKALGRLTMCYTIGSILGPAIGGWLGSTGDYYFGGKLAAYGSLISTVLSIFLPNFSGTSHSSQKHDGDTDKIKTISEIFMIVWLLLTTKIITSLANSMAASAMPLILKDTYGMQEQGLGLALSVMSAGNAVVNGLFLGPIVQLFGGKLTSVIGSCIISMFVGFVVQFVFAMPAVSSLTSDKGLSLYFLTAFSLSIFQYVLATTITGESTARVGNRSKGTLIGMEHSLFAASRIITPQIGVMLWKDHGVGAVSMACAVVFGVTYTVWSSFAGVAIDEKKEKIEEKDEK